MALELTVKKSLKVVQERLLATVSLEPSNTYLAATYAKRVPEINVGGLFTGQTEDPTLDPPAAVDIDPFWMQNEIWTLYPSFQVFQTFPRCHKSWLQAKFWMEEIVRRIQEGLAGFGETPPDFPVIEESVVVAG